MRVLLTTRKNRTLRDGHNCFSQCTVTVLASSSIDFWQYKGTSSLLLKPHISRTFMLKPSKCCFALLKLHT